MHDVAQKERTFGVKSTRKKVWIASGGVGALALLLIAIKALQIFTMMSTKPPMPVETVTSAVVKEEDWAPILSAVGSVSAVQGAIVSAELGGIVSEVKFENGGVAKQGDVLVKLDASAEEGQLHSGRSGFGIGPG